MKDYLRNGSVSRSEIVNDIKNGTLEKQAIEELVLRDDVTKSFIGSDYPNKVDKGQWTEQYLEKLVLASVAESFNKDYLFYLYDVAKYVRDNARKRKGRLSATAIIAGIVLVVVIVLIVLVLVNMCVGAAWKCHTLYPNVAKIQRPTQLLTNTKVFAVKK